MSVFFIRGLFCFLMLLCASQGFADYLGERNKDYEEHYGFLRPQPPLCSAVGNLFTEFKINPDKSQMIGGRELTPCSGTSLGTSGVQCFEFFDGNGEKVFLKKNFYIYGERFDSVLASVLLRFFSEQMELPVLSPSLRFVTDEKSKLIGILSHELIGFQSIADLYKNCNDQPCMDSKNTENPFYRCSLEQLSPPLVILYELLFRMGGGDLNPGNVCYKPKNVCGRGSTSLWFGTFDVDLATKQHAKSRSFEKHKEICQAFLMKNPSYKNKWRINDDQCARNVLSFLGRNPIALQESHDTLLTYFLETGDSGLRGSNPTSSAYRYYFCNYRHPCEKQSDPYNYKAYAHKPPLKVSDLVHVARDFTEKVPLDLLMALIKNVFANTKDGFETKVAGGLDFYKEYLETLEKSAPDLIKKRYEVFQCYARTDIQSVKDFSTLEKQCHPTEDGTKTKIEALYSSDVSQCYEEMKKILSPLAKRSVK